jgi:glycosyltransferase involved in cell wall biosynthesis
MASVAPPGAPLRVAFAHATLAAGGAERVVVEQARALAARGGSADVWLTGDAARDLEAEARAAHPGLRRVEAVATTVGLALRLVRGRYGLLVTSGSRKGLRAARIARRVPFARRPAVVVTLHTPYANHLDAVRPFAADVDAFVTAYDFRERVVTALGAPPDRVFVARPLYRGLLLGSDDATREAALALRASWGASDATTVVGYFGRVAPNKGVAPLARMVGRLAAGGLDVRLVVAGRTDDAAYDAEVGRAIASSPALSGRAVRLGSRSRSAALYAALDLFAYPTRRDGMPLVVVEAMSTGTPVLAFAIGGIAATLGDGAGAALVEKDRDDASEWTAADLARFEARLARLATDPAERRRLGEAGRARAADLVAGNDFARDFLAAVDAAVRRRAAGRGGGR